MKRRCSCAKNCAFHWAYPDYPQAISWGELKKVAVASERSSEVVNEKRKGGVDIAHIAGLSKRNDAVRLNPKRFHVYSKAVIPNG